MANDQRTAGFMQQLGLANPGAGQARSVGGGSPMSVAANISRTAGRGPLTRLAAGAAGGIKGLIDGEGGRGFQEFGRDFNRGLEAYQDHLVAQDLGIDADTVSRRRQLKKELAGVMQGGTLKEQANSLTEIARTANRYGDLEVAMRATQMRAQILDQIEQQKQAGIETDKAELELADMEASEDIGFTSGLVTAPDQKGKAVRIDRARARELGLPEEAVGQFLYIGPDGQQRLVNGAELVPAGQDGTLGVGSIRPKDDNIPQLARLNGATPGNIPKMRATMADISSHAGIITDLSNTLIQMNNPGQAFDLTGKAAIAGNKVVQFANNTADMMVEADQGVGASQNLGEYSWTGPDGKKVKGKAEAYKQFIERGKDEGFLLKTLNRLSGNEAESLADYLPTGALGRVEDVALYAEQYWANVMELAYLNARLLEPSNRGLSDKDIENALRRIGAHTADPLSFATRQIEMLERAEDALRGLGSQITVPSGAITSREDVIDFIYRPEVRTGTINSITDAKMGLVDLIGSMNPAGENPMNTPPQAANQEFSRVDQILSNPEEITQADINALSDEEAAELQRRIEAGRNASVPTQGTQ